MRIALVTPYSWTYEGGVNRHTQALAEHLLARENEVRVLAPWDPPDRLSAVLHRGAAPRRRPRPEYLIPLGRTVGFSANGAVSNIAVFPDVVATMRHELTAGEFDLVHVQEPPAPILGWDACGFTGAPVVGTFHAYAPKPAPQWLANGFGARRRFNRLSARIAVSEAAEWTGRRWYGGNYEVIPNGVELDAVAAAPGVPDGGSEERSAKLRILFVGRAEERKGLPVLLRAYEALIEHVPAELVIVGATGEEVGRSLADPDSRAAIKVLGAISRERLWEELDAADVLCAPSLSGESFGMVLTEAFAAGTPVVASAIAGYSDVVEDGVDGVLVPPGDPQPLAEELLRLQAEPLRRAAMGRAARRSAERFAWPRVAARIERVYERAIDLPGQPDRLMRAAIRHGFAPADGSPRSAPSRIPPPEPAPLRAVSRKRRLGRALGVGAGVAVGVVLTWLAAQRIGIDNVIESAVRSDFSWVLAATLLMCLSLFFRAGSWYWIARAAMPSSSLRRRDFSSATMIGVLMSATLPARVGEPARAMIIARRNGRFRETFPVLLGTLVSQTMLNILALVILGIVILGSTDIFHRASEQVFLFSLLPALLLAAVIAAPVLMRRNGSGRVARLARAARLAMVKVRRGLAIFRDPRRGPAAAILQLLAWAIQVAACYALAVAMGLDAEIGIVGAATVLFAVNVTAVIPATPSNIGVFQLAVLTVLSTGYGIGAADALAYGVILQAVEIATAVGLGLPALVREGMSWSDVRLRALSAAPVKLRPQGRSGAGGGAQRIPF